MDRLPEELLALIVENCDHASLKNLRLVSRRLNVASSAGTFEHFYQGLFEDGLEKLDSLCHSALSKHVKKYTLFSDILPSWDKDTWYKAINYRPDYRSWLASKTKTCLASSTSVDNAKAYKSLKAHSLSTEELERSFEAYLDILRQQRTWRQNKHGVRLKELLSTLPNLTEAHVKPTTPFSGGRTNQWPVWKGLRDKIKVGPDDWRYEVDHFDESYVKACGSAALALTEAVGFRSTFSGVKPITRFEVHSSHLGSYNDLLKAQRRAASLTAHESLTPFHFQPSDAGGLPILDTLELRARHHLRVDAFRQLTSLRLHVPHATLSARFHGLALQRETLEFLHASSQLRDLDLRFTDDELSPDDEILQLDELFMSDETVWPSLERLRLATNVATDALLKFLSSHASSLSELELRDMLIRDVGRAIAELPQIVKLQRVYMECLWDYSAENSLLSVLSRSTDFDDPYEQAVKSYLLGHTKQCPELEWDGGRGDGFHFGSEDEDVEDDDGDV